MPHMEFNVYEGVKNIKVKDGKKTENIELDAPLTAPYVVNWRQFVKYVDPTKLFGE